MPAEDTELSPESQPDLEYLLNALVEFARRMLEENGEFYPFGASLKDDGLIHSAEIDLASEHPSVREVLDALIAAFRDHAQDDAVRAIGICTDAHIAMPDGIRESDAISVQLEHRNGDAIMIFVPYDKPLMGAVRYEPVFAAEGTRVIFTDEPPN
jgi:hypothetical protein